MQHLDADRNLRIHVKMHDEGANDSDNVQSWCSRVDLKFLVNGLLVLEVDQCELDRNSHEDSKHELAKENGIVVMNELVECVTVDVCLERKLVMGLVKVLVIFVFNGVKQLILDVILSVLLQFTENSKTWLFLMMLKVLFESVKNVDCFLGVLNSLSN